MAVTIWLEPQKGRKGPAIHLAERRVSQYRRLLQPWGPRSRGRHLPELR